MTRVSKISLPAESVLATWAAPGDFQDAFSAPLLDPDLSPVEIYRMAARTTPEWVNGLMALRNRAVSLVGLKSVGHLGDCIEKPADAYRIGDKLGIFTIFDLRESELLLGIDDTHLDVRVSILKTNRDGQAGYVVSTAVKVHNQLGRLYMLPVAHIHPRVVQAMMTRTAA